MAPHAIMHNGPIGLGRKPPPPGLAESLGTDDNQGENGNWNPPDTMADPLPIPTLPAPEAGRNVSIVNQQGEVMEAMNAKHMVLIDSIINWAIANPGKPWTKCAAALGFTAHWVRLVVGTDAFKARYAQVAPELLRQVGIASLQDRIKGVTETVIERIEEKALVSESLPDLTDAAEVLLSHQFGKGGQAIAPPAVNLTVNQQIINQERANMLEGKKA